MARKIHFLFILWRISPQTWFLLAITTILLKINGSFKIDNNMRL